MADDGDDTRDTSRQTRSDGRESAPNVTRLFPRGHPRTTRGDDVGASGDVSRHDSDMTSDAQDATDTQEGSAAFDADGETTLPPLKNKRGRPRKPRPRLPDDDPFLLIDSLDAAGGRDGAHGRMPPAVAAAFRIYCAMAPSLRTIVALHKRLEWEWERAPTRPTLDNWSTRYDWKTLLREYDLNLARWRFAQSETDRREADSRQARAGRAMQQLAGNQIMRMVREANEWRPYVVGPDGQVLRDGRGNPVKAPKPSLSGMQGLALLYKIAVETERVALGAPTMVTSATVQGTLTGETTTTHVVMTLDEWRKQTALDRANAHVVGDTVDAPPDARAPLGLPAPDAPDAPDAPPPTPPTAPTAHPSHARGGMDALARAGVPNADDLPDEWFTDVDGPIVEADK